MKNLSLLKTIPFTLVVTLMFAACDHSTSSKSVDSVDSVDSETDKANLLLLREEEKLARDVYRYAYDETGIQVFKNIMSSEQKHMDQVLTILQASDIADPALANEGEFAHEEYQTLYDALVSQVDISSVEALKVGATIEDLDIADIESYIATTSNESILNMYASLQCGSRNHLRSFVSQLEAKGESYKPQYILAQTYSEIITSDNEKCGKN